MPIVARTLVIAIAAFLPQARAVADYSVTQASAQHQGAEVATFIARLHSKRFEGYVNSAFWTLIHDYSDSARLDSVLKEVQAYLGACEHYASDPSMLDRLGGFNAFKVKLAKLLHDDDQATRAFGAILLGVAGDHSYASQLGDLLTSRPATANSRYERGCAAIALGMLEAREYAGELNALLGSANPQGRSGAALGLALMGAPESESAIRKLLNDENESVREAARQALEELTSQSRSDHRP